MELIVQSLSGRVYVNFLEGNHEQQANFLQGI